MAAKQDWRKRQALQLVSQLPDGTIDALAILDHARDFVLWSREDADGPSSAVAQGHPGVCQLPLKPGRQAVLTPQPDPVRRSSRNSAYQPHRHVAWQREAALKIIPASRLDAQLRCKTRLRSLAPACGVIAQDAQAVGDRGIIQFVWIVTAHSAANWPRPDFFATKTIWPCNLQVSWITKYGHARPPKHP